MIDINKKVPIIKKELIEKQKSLNCNTVSIERDGIEFLYFKTLADGRKEIFKAGSVKNGQFITREI